MSRHAHFPGSRLIRLLDLGESLMSFFKPLAYISIPLLFLHTLSANSPLARYYIRLFLYVSTLGIVSLYGALSSIGLTLIGRRFSINHLTARAFYAVAGRAMGISFDVEGEEWLDKSRPAVLVGNHQSILDVLYLGRYGKYLAGGHHSNN